MCALLFLHSFVFSSSQSTGGSSEESDGPADMDSLMGSLREHM